MSSILARQTLGDPNDTTFNNDNDIPFWWTETGQIVRWVIFLGILFLVFAFLFIGYCHARRRINKGLPPLRYHRWMLNHSQRARYDPNYQHPSAYYTPYAPGAQYNMHPMPPPIYDPNAPMPPVYQPPAGATKVVPSQWGAATTRRPAAGGDPSPSYEAPQELPPAAAVQPNHTGASTTSNNPYRL